MNNGALIFAHNSINLDYSLMSLIAGGLAKKNLSIPVSLVTDGNTIDWMKTSNIYELAVGTFDKIIEIESECTYNYRNLRDGNSFQKVPFKNSTRTNAFELTPYDKTLLIDSDYLIFSNNLNNYWDCDHDIMISKAMFDASHNNRAGYHDRYVSDTGIHLYWATTVMFTKNKKSEIFFKLVDQIRKDYKFYADIYRFDSRMYRNDISFSIAKHILDGFSTNLTDSLPPVWTTIDTDILEHVSSAGKLTFLMSNANNTFSAMSLQGQDIHIMNKQSLVRNSKSLLGLI